MSNWTYRIPTLKDAPERLQGKAMYTESEEEPRLGLYCEEESHHGEPWFICSFTPNYPHLEATGDLSWMPSNDYRAGSGHLLRVAQVMQQLIVDDGPAPVDSNGIPMVDAAGSQRGRGRWPFECGKCGLRRTWRAESFQSAVQGLVRAGIKEITLTGLISAVDRLKK